MGVINKLLNDLQDYSSYKTKIVFIDFQFKSLAITLSCAVFFFLIFFR